MKANGAGSAWTQKEIAVTVDTYFEMLRAELSGIPVNKAHFNRTLQDVTGRSRGAIEFKHANISAVLLALRSFYIDGYKPRGNVQNALRREVERRLKLDSELEALMLKSVAGPVSTPSPDLRLQLGEAPVVEIAERIYHRQAIKHDFVRLESDRRELGLAGEVAVVNYERSQLVAQGLPRLAKAVEHVAVTQGDGLGFDVLSYDADGSEKLIEVKTTRRTEYWPFLATKNEISLSSEVPEKFYLYRLHGFGGATAGLFTMRGSLENTCTLVPHVFEAFPG
ncbi:DUF3883 domain-containing protein [Specibacter sp. NPDC057265]|uniref:DUF3883 domain-containing protein n=1 Tax=Specibacter sp. NPDC057265 TaxID=3346075 RepID=UPI003644BC98